MHRGYAAAGSGSRDKSMAETNGPYIDADVGDADDAAERPISKAIVERATRDEGWENKRREHAVERNGEAMISVVAQKCCSRR
jgi:hypothetical protein